MSTDPPAFDWESEEWCNRGLRYPKDDTPEVVRNTERLIRRIPPRWAHLLPFPKLSIAQLLAFSLPSQGVAMVITSATFEFSHQSPVEDLDSCSTRPIPAQKYLEKLEAEFGQAWFDGKRSITDNRYKASRLPIQALSLWKELAIIVRKRNTWRAAEEFLTSRERKPLYSEAVSEALQLFHDLQWGGTVQVLNARAPVENLAELLSEEWLGSEVVDMLCTHLQSRVRHDRDLFRKVVIAPSTIAQAICDIYPASELENASSAVNGSLRSYESYFRVSNDGSAMDGRTHLYLVVNVQNSHWVAVMVNFTDKTISYGTCVICS